MSASHDPTVPRPVIYAAGAMLLVSLVLAAVSRPRLVAEQARPRPAPLAALELAFEDRPDGSVAVIDAASGRAFTSLSPESNGFVRGVLRGMNRERKLESLGKDARFLLSREHDGRLFLEDLQTRRRVDVTAFGPDNAAAFARLLDTGRQQATR
ncbi:MAG: phosphonate-binding protein [Myxococcaceae bacterium]|jgi:putative photosynthetic complex assembly protein|nr:phosphonate-binding protein [Myxococcaceae bacterium]